MTKKLDINTIIFDLDGTLIDTELAASIAVKECFLRWGHELDRSDATYVTGRKWDVAFSYLLNKYPLPVNAEEARNQIMELYRKNLNDHLVVVAGAREAISTLASRYTLGLVSGSGRREILWALKKLEVDHHFKLILGAEDYAESKPSPEGYLMALDLLKAEPSASLIFEDSKVGIASGRAAGCYVVAVTSTNHFDQDVKEAHHQIHDLLKVTPQWVENLSFD
jgi:HAD superfamily hydrolase (TIGR01509 family)